MPPAPRPDLPAATGAAIWRVLLVEDDPEDYMLTRELLAESRAARVMLDWVPAPAPALEKLGREAFDAMLLDYRLGEDDGLALLRKVKAERPRLPVILLTGVGDRDVDLEAMRLGAADYLVKGRIDATLLERTIRYAIAQGEAVDKIARLNAELEARVRERTAALEYANRELEAFAFSVSHDLRAPLRVVEGIGRVLQEDFGERLGDEGLAHLGRIVRAGRTMSAMIEAMLRLSQASWTPPRVARVDLSALAVEIIDSLKAVEPARAVETRIEPGLQADGDPFLLRTVLENLLGNAWKFSARATPARIEFGAEAAENGPVYFVRDNGAGFDMAYADRLFGLFQRLHAQDAFPGNGAGLAIVERIIHRHGGRVWGEGAPGQGAVFRFTLGAWQ